MQNEWDFVLNLQLSWVNSFPEVKEKKNQPKPDFGLY